MTNEDEDGLEKRKTEGPVLDGYQVHKETTFHEEEHRLALWALVECCCFSVAKSCLTFCNPMDCSMPGFPVLHYLLELAQTHFH